MSHVKTWILDDKVSVDPLVEAAPHKNLAKSASKPKDLVIRECPVFAVPVEANPTALDRTPKSGEPHEYRPPLHGQSIGTGDLPVLCVYLICFGYELTSASIVHWQSRAQFALTSDL